MSHTEIIDDGVSAVTWEPTVSTVRMIDHIPSDSSPPYVAIGSMMRVSDRVAKLYGFSGALSRRHMWLLMGLLIRQGYEYAFIERIDGHAMPWAKRVEDGPFSGAWLVDLKEMKARRKGA